MGSHLVVSSKNGWHVSSDSEIDFERDIVGDEATGTKSVKLTEVCVANLVYSVVGNLLVGEQVDCMIMVNEDSNAIFSGEVQSVLKNKVVIKVNGKIEENNLKASQLSHDISERFNSN